jgi:hypothetical protein
MDALLDDPFSMEPFGCEAGTPATPLALACGHTFSRATVEKVRCSCSARSERLGSGAAGCHQQVRRAT